MIPILVTYAVIVAAPESLLSQQASRSVPSACRPGSVQALSGQQSESARLIEDLDSVTLGRLKLQFPKNTIKVEGVEVVDGDILFRTTFDAKRGTAIIYQDQLRTTELLRGQIRELCAHTYFAIPGTATKTRLKINPDQFNLEIQAITGSIATGLVGNLGVKSRFLKMHNETELLAVEDRLSGRVSMKVADATLDRVKFNFSGTQDSLLVTAAFSLPRQSEWLIDLATSRVLWESGTIVARDVRMEASAGSVINMGGIKADFRRLMLQAIEAEKESGKPTVTVNLKSMQLEGGSLEIDKGIKFKGALKGPLLMNGWWWSSLAEDGQLAANFYDLNRLKANLDVAEFSDGKGLSVEESAVLVDLTHLCVEEMAGSVTVNGGKIALAGAASGRVSLRSLSLTFDGPSDRLSGNGRIELNNFRISTEVQTRVVERCVDTMPVRINDAEGLSVQGDLRLVDGKTAIDMRMDEFSARVGLGLYRCEWDQKVGDLGRWEVVWDAWCPTWSEPLRTCRQTTVIWEGGPVSVHWVLEKQPTLIDTSVAIADLRVKSDPAVEDGKLRLCGGRLKFLSPNVNWWSLSPNFRASGTVFDVFRDVIKIFSTAILSSITVPTEGLASAFGSSGILVFQCN